MLESPKLKAMVPSSFCVMLLMAMFMNNEPSVFSLYTIAAGVELLVRLSLQSNPSE